MRPLFSLLFLLLLSQISWARSLDFYPFHFQYRYEDTADQAIETVLYQSFSLGLSVERMRATFAYSSVEDSTGNPSLKIETKVEELLAGFGYDVLSYTDGKLSLHGIAQGLIGTTQTRAETKLLGSSSSSSSAKQMVYGIGIEALVRVNYLVAGMELNLLNSKNFSPQVVPAAHFKIGCGIPFNYF